MLEIKKARSAVFYESISTQRSGVDILHRTTMRLVELLEELSIEQINLNDKQYFLIIDSFTKQQWVEVAVIYLNGVDKHHRTPGTVLLTIAGICDYYREHKNLTQKQSMYLAANLVRYWDQLGCSARAKLML